MKLFSRCKHSWIALDKVIIHSTWGDSIVYVLFCEECGKFKKTKVG